MYNILMAEKSKNLKTAIDRLEEITADLGRGNTDIETGLEKFREGVTLVKFCRSELKKAENEFEKLKAELEEGENESRSLGGKESAPEELDLDDEDVKPEIIPF